MKDRELEKYKSESAKKEKIIYDDFEMLRKGEEDRFQNLLKEVSKRTSTTSDRRSEDYLQEDIKNQQHENRMLHNQMENQKEQHDRQLSFISLSKVHTFFHDRTK